MNGWQTRLLWITTWLISLSGSGLYVVKHWLKNDDPFSVVNHPWQPFLLHAHVLVAPAVVFALGMVVVGHVIPRYRSRKACGRRTGFLTAAIITPMIGTGYLLQVVTHAAWLSWMAWAHVMTGLVFLAAMMAHEIATRKYQGKDSEEEGIVSTMSPILR